MQNFWRRLAAWLHHLPGAQYVTIYLIFGLILSGISLLVLTATLEDVLEGDTLVAFDIALANQLHIQATPTITSFYVGLSWLGAPGIYVVGILVALYFILRRRWLDLVIWIVALVGGGLLNDLMKQVIARPRPIFVDPLVIEQNFSFPSAHSMSSLIAYGMLAYFLWRSTRNEYLRTIIVFAAGLLILLIGISRMALGVHYFSDVVGGFAAGGIWLGICISALNLLEERRRQRSLSATGLANREVPLL